VTAAVGAAAAAAAGLTIVTAAVSGLVIYAIRPALAAEVTVATPLGRAVAKVVTAAIGAHIGRSKKAVGEEIGSSISAACSDSRMSSSRVLDYNNTSTALVAFLALVVLVARLAFTGDTST
jgi:hypothetical protein